MKKAIYVMDMPENCNECPLELDVANTKGSQWRGNICRGCGQRNADRSKKPDWCPLAPMPERKEEQGILLKLPCKIGDTIYKIPSHSIHGINIVNRHPERNRVYSQKVCRISIYGNGTYTLETCDGFDAAISESFEVTWFLTEDEAKAKLKEQEELWAKCFGQQHQDKDWR